MGLFFPRIKMLKIVCLSSLILAAAIVGASDFHSQESNDTIKQLYHTINRNSKSGMAERLAFFSASFLGKPYLLGALGEGPDARFDQSPLSRTDAFDCETFVDTVLALALSENQNTFPLCLNKVRYLNGKVSFLTRNHFTALDWNQNNQRQGFLKDITNAIKDENHHKVAKMAVAVIDKPSWYRHMSADRIKLFPSTTNQQQQQTMRLLELQNSGHSLPIVEEKIPYIPFTVLYDKQGNPNNFLFSQIPNASIIEIIRPNWEVKKQIGTNLNVSHLGFAFWVNSELLFREASSTEGKVVDVSLIDYLKQARSSPTIKGINVQVIVPKKHLAANCIAQAKAKILTSKH